MPWDGLVFRTGRAVTLAGVAGRVGCVDADGPNDAGGDVAAAPSEVCASPLEVGCSFSPSEVCFIGINPGVLRLV